jgi:hypothetical protein
MLMCVFTHSRFIENLPVGSWETNPCFFRGVLSHPQSNSQVEHSNGMILQGLKPKIFDRLEPYTKKWVKELRLVLWALRTTLSRDMGHTPFSLVYGSEAMLPTEVEHKSFRVQLFNEE